MKYRVVLSPRAVRDLSKAHLWASSHAPATAARWLNRFHAALQTLSENPQRCGIADESELVEREIREFLFGRHRSVWRALFTVRADEVRVLHVRRASMDTATSEDVDD
jgi:plasmid stabilization system protein ParE